MRNGRTSSCFSQGHSFAFDLSAGALFKLQMVGMEGCMTTNGDKSKGRRKWETPAVSVLALRDTRGAPTTGSDLALLGPSG